MATVSNLLLIATLLIAVIFDSRSHRIPNWLSLSGWVIAPFLFLYFDGSSGFLSSLYGLGLILVLTFPLFAFGWMGAGDVKLMATVGGYVGIGVALHVLLGIFITGAVFAIVMLVYRHALSNTITRIRTSVGLSMIGRKALYIGPGEEEKSIVLPYAIPIMIGTVISLLVLNNYF